MNVQGPDAPDKTRRIVVWINDEQETKLDDEVLVQRRTGEHQTEDGKRIHVNRGTIVRSLIDAHLPSS